MEEELIRLRADMAAFEMILAGVLSEVGASSPEALTPILRGIDSAANACERLSIEGRERARHFTLALQRIEEMRVAIKGNEEKPNRS